MQCNPKRVAARWISAAPLDDYVSLPPRKERVVAPLTDLIGEHREKDPEFLAQATKIFSVRRESWAIIVSHDDISVVREYVKTQPKLAKSKIIVISSFSYAEDFKDADFVVFHDIIGHSLYEAAGSPRRDTKFFRELTGLLPSSILHLGLPKHMRLATEHGDVLPDIYAVLFFYEKPGEILASAMKEVPRLYPQLTPEVLGTMRERLKEYIYEMHEATAEWASWFKPGSPRVIKPW